MQNRRHPQQHKIPRRCPICGGMILPDCSRYGERFKHGWHCIFCGLTDDSADYHVSSKRKSVVVAR